MDLYITCSMRMRLIRELLQRQKSAIFFSKDEFLVLGLMAKLLNLLYYTAL